jgi:hypothetical protein
MFVPVKKNSKGRNYVCQVPVKGKVKRDKHVYLFFQNDKKNLQSPQALMKNQKNLQSPQALMKNHRCLWTHKMKLQALQTKLNQSCKKKNHCIYTDSCV